MTLQELPLCCRQCVHKQSQYLYPKLEPSVPEDEANG